MSKVDWDRWNRPQTQWAEKDYDWSDRHMVPKDLGPHAHKKAVMVLLSPLFTGASMLAAVAIDNPSGTKDLIRWALHMDRTSSDAMRTAQYSIRNPNGCRPGPASRPAAPARIPAASGP